MSPDDPRRPLTAQWLAGLVGEQAALSALAVTHSSASTNTDLIAALESDPQAWPHLSALVTDHQTAGRGRAGRSWETPRGAALTVSYVLRPALEATQWGLVPLAVGVAVVRTLRADHLDAWLKWPNDVVVNTDGDVLAGWGQWRKVAGILCERRNDAVVAGVGINVSQTLDELPVAHAASLASVGAPRVDRYAVLETLSMHVGDVIGEVEADPLTFIRTVEAVTATIGQQVVVERAGQVPLTGRATGIGADGALQVRTASGTVEQVVAGDVRLRVAH